MRKDKAMARLSLQRSWLSLVVDARCSGSNRDLLVLAVRALRKTALPVGQCGPTYLIGAYASL
ncbi:MAG: hypothetical protein C4318_08450 [Acidimicrobiia bacterium]